MMRSTALPGLPSDSLLLMAVPCDSPKVVV